MQTELEHNQTVEKFTRQELIRRRRILKRKKKTRMAGFIAGFIIFGSAIGLGGITLINKVTAGKDNITGGGNVQTAAAVITATPEPKINKIPSSTEETDLINIIAHAGMTKHCYLTFDDGPSKNVTPQILDTLAKYNAKATFFEVGKYIENNPEMTKRVYDEGHLIANHSYSHDYNTLYASEGSFKSEIEKCYDTIKNVTGDENPFKLIRFPGGSFNAGDHAAEKQVYKGTLADMGFYYCDWNSLDGDAEGKSKNADELFEYFKKSAQGFNNLIVLMHDTDAKQGTADALPKIIEYLQGEGYTFHRLDDIDYNPKATAVPTAVVSD